MYRRHIRLRMRWGLRRLRTFLYHSVLHADDPPHRLALGAAIGMFTAFTPTVGFQMMLSVCLAWALRANKAIGLPVVWISNPATMIPMYYSCYQVGRLILGRPSVPGRWWAELTEPPPGWWSALSFYWSRLIEIAQPLWVGSVVLGILAGYVTYYATYHVICAYRMREWGQLLPPIGHRLSHVVRRGRRKGAGRAKGPS